MKPDTLSFYYKFDKNMKIKQISVLLGVYLLLTQVFGYEVEHCPDKYGDGTRTKRQVHWQRCSSNNDCSTDKVCLRPVSDLPGLWICAHKPCRYSWTCKQGQYCYKSVTSNTNNPVKTWFVKGICCDKIPIWNSFSFNKTLI